MTKNTEAFEEYKLFVEHIHTLTDRRQTVTITYLSVNAALVSAVTFLFLSENVLEWGRQLLALGMLIAGILACDFWRRLIVRYSRLLKWWYEKMRLLESQMPNSNKLFTAEYEEVYESQKDKGFSVMRYEVRLTWLFTVIYAIVSLALMVSFVITI